MAVRVFGPVLMVVVPFVAHATRMTRKAHRDTTATAGHPLLRR
jgi:hypothetical protein